MNPVKVRARTEMSDPIDPNKVVVLTGAGISAEYVPVRHMLNLESVITYEGTETVHQLVLGRELTGINAF